MAAGQYHMLSRCGNLMEQDEVLEPRPLCISPLHKFIFIADLSKNAAHTSDAYRKAFHVGKLAPKVCREAINDFGTPTFLCCRSRMSRPIC
jgi:hypothetical protein